MTSEFRHACADLLSKVPISKFMRPLDLSLAFNKVDFANAIRTLKVEMDLLFDMSMVHFDVFYRFNKQV